MNSDRGLSDLSPPPTRTGASNSAPVRHEPGSFRDPDSRVFYSGGRIYRALSGQGLADFEALAATDLLDDARIIGTRRVAAEVEAEVEAETAGLITTGLGAVLEHDRVPFISHPYEWPFSMLKDAALLQLDLLLSALDHDLILKDSTPYNVQFEGARPVFIDVGSFERLREGELWVGYRQFCMLYLYPLLLQAVKGVEFHPWLRGSIDGITAQQMRSLSSTRDRFRRGFTTHIFLHAWLDRRARQRHGDAPKEATRATSSKQLILANVRKMRRFVDSLKWDPPRGVWVSYGEHNSYDADDALRKDEFVRSVVRAGPWGLAWDLGANNGRHSRIAAEGARYVVAIDADHGPVELFYRQLRDAAEAAILPLTMNLADPSPALGWRALERRALIDRGAPDLVLALALIHHLAIGSNLPVKEIVGWLADLGGALIVEFPDRDDPMVRKLLAPKRDGLHPDYERDYFEACLHEAFTVHRVERLGSGTRTLYFATPRGA